MCLAIPGKIENIYEQNGITMGKVDFGGTYREVCLVYVPEAKIGDYAIIHVGFAISLLDEEQAMLSLSAINEVIQAGNNTS